MYYIISNETLECKGSSESFDACIDFMKESAMSVDDFRIISEDELEEFRLEYMADRYQDDYSL
jgi:ferredoxin-fold anticodon binding domain-containing protein